MKRVSLAVVVCLTLVAAAARAEDAVLVSSTVTDYVPGSVITGGTLLNLPAGATAVLLFRSGTMIRLKGPFQEALSLPASDANSIATLVAELRGSGSDASVIGASRALPTAKDAMHGQRIMIEPTRSAIYCVGDADSVWLTGAEASPTPLLRLRRGKSVREVKWTSSEIEWPSDLLIEDGDRFETLGASSDPVATIIFRRLGKEPSETAWLADSMLGGCRDQAAPALRELAKSLAAE
jgi:hypothetical protein